MARTLSHFMIAAQPSPLPSFRVGLEIERKFLVHGEPWHGHPGTLYRQAYLSTDPDRIVRVRLTGQQAFLTIKGRAHDLVRAEFEYAIPIADAEHLLEKIALPSQIKKTRYRIPHEKHLWEIDVFHGEHEGLVTAEVEMSSPTEEVILPPWVGKEISRDPAFSNSRLIEEPHAWRTH